MNLVNNIEERKSKIWKLGLITGQIVQQEYFYKFVIECFDTTFRYVSLYLYTTLSFHP